MDLPKPDNLLDLSKPDKLFSLLSVGILLLIALAMLIIIPYIGLGINLAHYFFFGEFLGRVELFAELTKSISKVLFYIGVVAFALVILISVGYGIISRRVVFLLISPISFLFLILAVAAVFGGIGLLETVIETSDYERNKLIKDIVKTIFYLLGISFALSSSSTSSSSLSSSSSSS